MGNNPAPSIGRWLIGLPNGGERKQTKRTDKQTKGRKEKNQTDQRGVREREREKKTSIAHRRAYRKKQKNRQHRLKRREEKEERGINRETDRQIYGLTVDDDELTCHRKPSVLQN